MMNSKNDSTAPSDTLLLETCLRKRDGQAFSVLVDRYKNLVCSVAYGIVGDLGQSEDVAQETFVTAWKKLETLREPEKLKSWLCGIARHLALSSVRKRKPDQDRPDTLAAETPDENSPDRIAVTNEEQTLIWNALEALPETYREPLILYYREDQSVARVAEDLGLSEDAVKQRLFRGRTMLRDNVLELVEGTLIRTRPGATFTLAVLGALPGLLATSAKAATLGAAGKAGSSAVAASGTAAGGALAGLLGGVFGCLAGWWVSDQTVRYAEQRQVIRRGMIRFFVVLSIFQTPWLTMWLGWWSAADLGPQGYMIFWFGWMISFFLFLSFFSWRMGKESRRICEESEKSSAAALPASPLRQFLQSWEGRRWESRARLLGLPLVSIAFSDPDRDFSGYGHSGRKAQCTAKGWIALGDKAIGLVAFGNLAAGGFAVGSVACGLVSFGGIATGGIAFGGLTLALLSFGGLALGVGALGGLAVGWMAFGGAAIAWKAAMGGFALAHDVASGGSAMAAEANTEAARAALEGHSFFNLGQAYLETVQSPWFLPVFLAATGCWIAGILMVGFRKRKSGDDSESVEKPLPS